MNFQIKKYFKKKPRMKKIYICSNMLYLEYKAGTEPAFSQFFFFHNASPSLLHAC
jgi:hypothetical protein